MPFPAFSAGDFSQLFILPISSVVGNKVQCLRKKRPVTPSESDYYGIVLKIKEILTQEHQFMAKHVSVIPRFSRLRRSPLARARILPCPKEKYETTRSQNLDDVFSVISIWTEPYNKDKTVRN